MKNKILNVLGIAFIGFTVFLLRELIHTGEIKRYFNKTEISPDKQKEIAICTNKSKEQFNEYAALKNDKDRFSWLVQKSKHIFESSYGISLIDHEIQIISNPKEINRIYTQLSRTDIAICYGAIYSKKIIYSPITSKN